MRHEYTNLDNEGAHAHTREASALNFSLILLTILFNVYLPLFCAFLFEIHSLHRAGLLSPVAFSFKRPKVRILRFRLFNRSIHSQHLPARFLSISIEDMPQLPECQMCSSCRTFPKNRPVENRHVFLLAVRSMKDACT